jgi:hypothetical protein
VAEAAESERLEAGCVTAISPMFGLAPKPRKESPADCPGQPDSDLRIEDYDSQRAQLKRDKGDNAFVYVQRGVIRRATDPKSDCAAMGF